MKQIIVIPTYWTRAGRGYHPGDRVFDHPTPLDEEGTLQRCLESLNLLEESVDVILIVVPTHSDIQDALEAKITKMLSRMNLRHNVRPIFPSTIGKIHSSIGDDRLKDVLNLDGYPQVRNACILLPYLMGFNSFLLLDDDEIIIDKHMLEKALELLGSSFQGRRVLAKAGVYIQAHGSPFFKDAEPWWRCLLDNKRAMNKAFKILGSSQRFMDTSFAFGGNMVVSGEILDNGIPFDPYITRGEDTDFLVNVKSAGYGFIIDTHLKILHLPPKSHNPDWQKLQQESMRLLYMRSKLKRLKEAGVVITPKDLKPYPGIFLDLTLKYRILLTSLLLTLDYFRRFRFKDAEQALCTVKTLFTDYSTLVSRYYSFKARWRSVVQRLLNHQSTDRRNCGYQYHGPNI